ncbi:cellulose binding domain-containing protein [Glycomyces xiaoerkulensis]|uniref:cellulose binding domain-containing protein n=1 Tax=Glycomyces xiaoerkulensis TaxID=2038139 RepID=UPI000C26B5B1|nr:cellulose binding domain-containing protein [Glycomyces xiaoerkulensis]
MRAWKNRRLLRGRLHGRALKALGAVAATAAVIAAWQFALLVDEDESAFPELGGQDPLADGPAGGSLGEVAEATAASSPTAAAESDEPSPDAESGSPSPAADGDASSEPEPSGPECAASLALEREWGNNVSVDVEVANSGEEPIDGWEVVLDFENVEVKTTWGLTRIEGDRYGNGWTNGDLDPGETTDPGFTGRSKGEPDLPETVPCSPA